jgi:aminobenzoyl-glutamate utilization protein B
VQAKAVVRYLVRSRDLAGVRALFARVVKVSEGAALMTDTAVEHRVFSGDANLVGNGPLEDVMAAEFRHLGPPAFDDADRAFAREIQATLRPEDIAAAFKRAGQRPREGAALGDWLVDRDDWSTDDIGSTDVGSVSWVVPTVQAAGTTYAIGTPGHSWQLTAQGKAPAAHKGMVHVAKAMAGTALALLGDPDAVARAKADHRARVGDAPFVPPIPDGVEPRLDMAAGH